MKTITIQNIVDMNVQGFTSRDVANLAMDFVRANEANEESKSVLRNACKLIKARVEDTTRKVASRKASKKVFDQLVAFGMTQFPLAAKPQPKAEPAPVDVVEPEMPSPAKLNRMKKADLIAMLQAMQS